MTQHDHGSFTFIELLLVIGIIAVLMGIVVIAINPVRRMTEDRNLRRHADITAIADAVDSFAQAQGALPAGITPMETEICRSGISIDCTGMVNLNALTGSYLVAIPGDPLAPAGRGTQYTIKRDGTHFTVRAPRAEDGQKVEVTK